MRRLTVTALLFLLSIPCLWAQLPPLPTPLKLPPGGVEVLPVSKAGSYFGDAIRVVNCPSNADEPFGLCENLVFGGMALMDSHVTGKIQIRFYPPANNISHFEILHPGNLSGDDTVISAPQGFRMPAQQNFIFDPPGQVSSGDLNLITGEVTNLNYRVLFYNSFYLALQQVNPNLKAEPFVLPGGYGSFDAHFSQRPDGLLDFTVLASTFAPLGQNINGDLVRFPLPFCGPLLQCASVPAPGTALHPHLRISTVDPADLPCGAACPSIPAGSTQQFTVFTYNSSLGDNFGLNVPALGIGTGFARSQMQGRVQIQFGERTGDFVPVYVSSLPPAGIIGEPPAPLPRGFSIGLMGHREFIRFPLQTYTFGDTVTFDDTFEPVVGNLDLKTGKVIDNLNYRSFFSQSIFQALLRLNPGVAPASQRFRGPASFETDSKGQLIFRFNGETAFPFPVPVFPTADGSTGYVVGPGSRLDLFLRIQAMRAPEAPAVVKSGSGNNLVSSHDEEFSYKYMIPCSPAGKDFSFEYTNHSSGSSGGTFTMQTLASVSCINSRGSAAAAGDADGITFTGFGTWSADSNPHVVSVQISTSPGAPYVTILVDGGITSNVNLKPVQPTLP